MLDMGGGHLSLELLTQEGWIKRENVPGGALHASDGADN